MELKEIVDQVHLVDKKDGWIWKHGGEGSFTVASARLLIDEKILDIDVVATRWVNMVLAKVNVFMWRLCLNQIPTKCNLDKRGIDVGSVLCGVY